MNNYRQYPFQLLLEHPIKQGHDNRQGSHPCSPPSGQAESPQRWWIASHLLSTMNQLSDSSLRSRALLPIVQPSVTSLTYPKIPWKSAHIGPEPHILCLYPLSYCSKQGTAMQDNHLLCIRLQYKVLRYVWVKSYKYKNLLYLFT